MANNPAGTKLGAASGTNRPLLLKDWRQVDKILVRPPVPELFGDWSSGKFPIERASFTKVFEGAKVPFTVLSFSHLQYYEPVYPW